MSSSVGRNSLILAAGTAASRVSGMVRTIFLVAALGATGIAANAYQAGAAIPQVIFNLLSTGVFNTVLMPQIVRTFKDEDSEEKLNKLITLSIVILAAITVIMMGCTPLLTQLYVDSSWTPEQMALANAFTLWCMPQIFFYGLYVVLGQILAAKNRFGTYAWSSVGANVISCIGFGAFVLLFGSARTQPPDFWTTDKIALTAGGWTLGVAFQALILFAPIARCGIRYRPRLGIKGIGLRSMGQVAAWTFGIVIIDQAVGIYTTNIMTGAPKQGGDMLGIAGNATYMNAMQVAQLPYALITASLATAIFPRLSQMVLERRIDDARAELSSALRTTGMMMIFCTAVFMTIPSPIVKAILPSANATDVALIAMVLMALAVTTLPSSANALLQKSFYAFEDGRSPFIYNIVLFGSQTLMLVATLGHIEERYWTVTVVVTSGIGQFLGMAYLYVALRRKCGGYLDGRRILGLHVKSAVAGVAAAAAGLLLRDALDAVMRVPSVPMHTQAAPASGSPDAGAGVDAAGSGAGAGSGVHAPTALDYNWLQAIVVCCCVGLVMLAVYAAILWVLRCGELTDLAGGVLGRFVPALRRGSAQTAAASGTQMPDAGESAGHATGAAGEGAPAAGGTDAGPGEAIREAEAPAASDYHEEPAHGQAAPTYPAPAHSPRHATTEHRVVRSAARPVPTGMMAPPEAVDAAQAPAVAPRHAAAAILADAAAQDAAQDAARASAAMGRHIPGNPVARNPRQSHHQDPHQDAAHTAEGTTGNPFANNGGFSEQAPGESQVRH